MKPLVGKRVLPRVGDARLWCVRDWRGTCTQFSVVPRDSETCVRVRYCLRDVRKANVLPVSCAFAWLGTGRVRLCSAFGEAVQVRDLRLFNGRPIVCVFFANT